MPLRKHGTFKKTMVTTLSVAAVGAALAPSAMAGGLLGGLFGGTTATPKPVATPTPKPVATPAAAATPKPAATPTPAAAASDISCPELPTTKAFAKIGDLADYSLAPTGDFESGLSGWSISGAGKIVNGNESVGILPGTHSLAMGGGIVSGPTTVTSPAFCVDSSHPYFRFLTKANGPIGLMATYIKYTALDGSTTSSSVQSTVSTSLLPGGWKASELNPLSINIPLVNNGGKAARVQIQWVSPGSVLGASYNIDDILIDPYRRG